MQLFSLFAKRKKIINKLCHTLWYTLSLRHKYNQMSFETIVSMKNSNWCDSEWNEFAYATHNHHIYIYVNAHMCTVFTLSISYVVVDIYQFLWWLYCLLLHKTFVFTYFIIPCLSFASVYSFICFNVLFCICFLWNDK